MIRIGCSGWQYKHWRGLFYPEEVPTKDWLALYTAQFDTVELNTTFYHQPKPAAVNHWRERTPKRFVFAWKASRYFSHFKRLFSPHEEVPRLLEPARLLEAKLGPVLFQLPPRWHADPERLRALVRELPNDVRFAIEFRDPTWYCDAVYEVLEEGRVALCVHDMPASKTPLRFVGPFAYVRFHGATGKYQGDYPARTLEAWADRLVELKAARKHAYVYFNNDVGGFAPKNALTLRELVAKRL